MRPVAVSSALLGFLLLAAVAIAEEDASNPGALSACRDQYKELSKQLQDQQAQSQELQQSIENQNTLHELEKDTLLSKHQEHSRNLMMEAERLRAEFVEKERTLNAKIDALEKKEREPQASSEDNARIAGFESQVKDLSRKLLEAEKKSQEYEEQINQLESGYNDQLSTMAETLNDTLKDADASALRIAELEASQHRGEGATSTESESKQDVTQLRRELERMKSQNSGPESQSGTSSDEIETARLRIADLEQQLAERSGEGSDAPVIGGEDVKEKTGSVLREDHEKVVATVNVLEARIKEMETEANQSCVMPKESESKDSLKYEKESECKQELEACLQQNQQAETGEKTCSIESSKEMKDTAKWVSNAAEGVRRLHKSLAFCRSDLERNHKAALVLENQMLGLKESQDSRVVLLTGLHNDFKDISQDLKALKANRSVLIQGFKSSEENADQEDDASGGINIDKILRVIAEAEDLVIQMQEDSAGPSDDQTNIQTAKETIDALIEEVGILSRGIQKLVPSKSDDADGSNMGTIARRVMFVLGLVITDLILFQALLPKGSRLLIVVVVVMWAWVSYLAFTSKYWMVCSLCICNVFLASSYIMNPGKEETFFSVS